jgi:hypothetical protein
MHVQIKGVCSRIFTSIAMICADAAVKYFIRKELASGG